MTKDFKTQMKETHRKHEEEKQRLQKDMEKERRNFKEQRKNIEKEVRSRIKLRSPSPLTLLSLRCTSRCSSLRLQSRRKRHRRCLQWPLKSVIWSRGSRTVRQPIAQRQNGFVR